MVHARGRGRPDVVGLEAPAAAHVALAELVDGRLELVAHRDVNQKVATGVDDQE